MHKILPTLHAYVTGDFILCDDKYTNTIDDFPSYHTILHLTSYGLLLSSLGLQRSVEFVDTHKNKHVAAFVNDQIVIVILADNDEKIRLPAYGLTPSGKQLYDNLGARISSSYLRVLARYFRDKTDAELTMAPVIERLDNQIRYGQLTDVLSGQPYQD